MQKTRILRNTTVDIIFFVAFRRVRVVAQSAHSLHHVCPHAHPSACMNTNPSGWIFMQYYIGNFY